ncbi:uncharacterized protein LOC122040275 isoform X2 [Zingiber officinale]|uniref:uncharacterized protein LOC122040275 isoform X2 n=1 Tax=Zingiber officinale TaxID=94328 RepID=UPI001C4DB307|nr:uncharacterized protein LOC122040275 isoform X2 [Zingiber officinale]
MTDHNNKRRREQEGRLEDRLTSLHDDLLISILSFLSIKQRVALSAVCARFRLLLPSIPRLDAFRLDVRLPSGGVDIHQELTFPRALIRQCHVVFRDEDDDAFWHYLPKPLEQLLVDDLSKAGVQDLILKTSADKGWLDFDGRDCGLFGIKSLRSLSLDRIRVLQYFDRRPLSPLGCALLTSLKMEFCILCYDFLRNLFVSCPFLETLQLIWFSCIKHRLSIHSASIKNIVLVKSLASVNAIDIHCPKLESLKVEVVNELRIEAPKVLAEKIENDEFIYPDYKENAMIFNLDFNLQNRSSTMILTQFLRKCNDSNTRFNILADSTHIESTNEDDCLLHGSTEVELIDLQMRMPKRTFEGFLLNQKEMTEELKEMGLQMLRSRTSTNQFKDILASEESLFQVSSSIANCIEMKF